MIEGDDLENLPRRLANSGAVKIRAKLGTISGGRVLDVGTGPGDFIDVLMKTLRDYDNFIGIDISLKDLESARKKFKDQPVTLVEMNAESLEFDDSSFDAVCISYSLHHLGKISLVLSEMLRVLKPGGTFILQEEFRDGQQTEAQKTNMLQHAWDAQIDSLLGTTHNTTFTKQRIKSIITNLQLEKVEIFESTHAVQCLFCDDRFKCEDPKNEERIERSLKEIDDNLQRLKKISDQETRVRLQKTAEKLKERNKEFGNATPSLIFATGRKAN
ncbi:MAG: class I SAM-dependent methyltransferase [Candidatus Bathyarchaeota archaeon]|nr:MAG: class I SAM-dependent methyltransferase [Candidatus Bathyarchaeota archaeon]